MPINLSKGQKVDLTKGNPGLKSIMVGLGWDVNAFDTGADFDLDAAAFMCGSNGKRSDGGGDARSDLPYPERHRGAGIQPGDDGYRRATG